MGQQGAHPLNGVTVLDLSTFVTGGFATMMLANQGADVIKVELPETGDTIRHSGPPFEGEADPEGDGVVADEHGESPYFWTVSYGKRSIELNLKSEEGTQALYDLAAEADVLVENFRPGAADRLNVGYDDIRAVNDEIIYASISAFGETGPWAERPGYDMLMQGLSGIMSLTGSDDEPVKVGVPITDLITAMWTSFGVVNALYRRERTGDGERVELGMLDATLPWLTKQAGKLFAGEKPTDSDTNDRTLAPYSSYPTADGHINVALANQELWEGFCAAIDNQELKNDDRYASNAGRVEHRDELKEELSEIFQKRTTEEWLDVLVGEHDLPFSDIHDIEEALYNEQADARGVISTTTHPVAGDIPVIEHPLNYDRAEAGFEDASPPLLGENTEDVLHEVGYDDEDIDELKEAGAIPNHG